MSYRYSYEKNKKHLCPSCNKKTFVRFIDNTTGEYLPGIYGRCDREGNCTYVLHPVNDGYAKHMLDQEQGEAAKWTLQKPAFKPPPIKPKVYIPNALVTKSKASYKENVFVNNLLKTLPSQLVADTMALYQIGSSDRWKGSTVFWFIDSMNRVCAGQSKLFDGTNHTVKYLDKKQQKKSCTTYITATIKYNLEKNGEPVPRWLADYNNQDDKVTCLYGEHLLNHFPNKIIALVEAPKTAIIASMYFSQFLWLAVGGLSYLTIERVKVLKGRNVILFPDIGKVIEGKKTAFERWNDKAKEFAHIAKFKVSDYLEMIATDKERNEGLDLADWLINVDYLEFIKSNTEQRAQKICESNIQPENILILAITPPFADIVTIEPIEHEGEALKAVDFIGEAIAHYKKFYTATDMPAERYFLSYSISITKLLAGQSAQCFTDAALLQLTKQMNV